MNSPRAAHHGPTYEEDSILELLNQGNPPIPPAFKQELRIPAISSFSQSRLFLMVQNPFQLYAYWDLSPRHLRKILRHFPREDRSHFHVVVRCLLDGQPSAVYFDVGATNHWWFAALPDNAYQAQLCLYSADYGVIPFFSSNKVKTPTISFAPVSPLIPESAAPLPLLEKLIYLSGVAFEPTSAQTVIKTESDLPTVVLERGHPKGLINSVDREEAQIAELVPNLLELSPNERRPTSSQGFIGH